MDYKIEELPFAIKIEGKEVPVLLNCKIVITDWDFEPADSGMPVDAWRGAEPAHAEYYTATDFDFDGYVNVLNLETEQEVDIYNKPDNLYRQRMLHALREVVWEFADWDTINEQLTENNGG